MDDGVKKKYLLGHVDFIATPASYTIAATAI
jgi:hypothetical protein